MQKFPFLEALGLWLPSGTSLPAATAALSDSAGAAKLQFHLQLVFSCSANLQGYLQFPQPLLLYKESGPRVNNSPSFLARGQNCWNWTSFHINGPDCLTVREKGKQLSASNLKELKNLNSWKKLISQTWKSNITNVYFPNIVDRNRKNISHPCDNSGDSSDNNHSDNLHTMVAHPTYYNYTFCLCNL